MTIIDGTLQADGPPRTLAEICADCKANHPHCDGCCTQCTDKCNAAQLCGWPLPKGESVTENNYEEATGTALAVANHEDEVEELSRLEGANKREIESYLDRRLGNVQAARMIGDFSTLGALVWLKEIKDRKLYKVKGQNWEQFCQQHVGRSRRAVDDQLINLKALGESFLESCDALGMGYREIRQLRMANQDGVFELEGDVVVIGEERIPLDHKDELRLALEQVIEDKLHLRDQIRKKDEEIEKERKARERVIQEETKALTIERDALVKDLDHYKSLLPEGETAEWMVKAIQKAASQAEEFAETCNGIMADERLKDDLTTQGHLYGLMEVVDLNFSRLRERIDAMISGTTE